MKSFIQVKIYENHMNFPERSEPISPEENRTLQIRLAAIASSLNLSCWVSGKTGGTNNGV